MNIVVLDAMTMGEDLNFDCLNSLGNVSIYDLTAPNQVIGRIETAETVILNKVKLNRENLAFARNLKLICITATGFDNVDVSYCKERGIAVCNVAGYSTDSVVQLTVAMVFSLATHLEAYNSYVKSGCYTDSGIFNHLKPVFHEISGMTWGVVGLGNIGKKVANVAKAMGCRVLVHKKTPVSEFECVSMERICEECDIITLHTPLNNETYHLINEERLARMKKNAILVNVARGAVVDEAAVAKAVLEHRIGGVGIDVYSAEPLAKDSPYQAILDCENVIFTPHMAWGSIDARKRCLREIVLNIESFLSGTNRSRVV